MNIIDNLTKEEQAYFVACTDIFHDSPYSVIGRPSVSNQLQNTVCMNLERTITNTNFSLLDPTANWSLNVVSLPFLTSHRLTTCVDTGFSINKTSTFSTQDWGGVTMFASSVGANTINPASQIVSLNGDKFFYPEYDGSVGSHVPRPFYEVLSIGIECINATPALYKSGNVTRYRVPTQGRKSTLNTTFAGVDTRNEYYCYPMPPINEAYATQYPDSVIDEAAAGSYQMHALQDQVSDFYEAGNSLISFSSPTPPASTTGAFNSWTSNQSFSTATSNNPPLVRGDFDIIGSYFTGLSPQSVIKIRYRAIISLVPSSTDASLVSLAKVSPPPNPALDQLIALTQATFTPGIQASMNASGDWWRVVLKGVAKVAKPVGKALGSDTAGGKMVVGAGELANMLADINKKKKKKNNAGATSPPKAQAKAGGKVPPK